MEQTDHLIVGAGVTGLAFANALPEGARWQMIEQLDEPGGYCRTVRQDGFVWDFSGHFFHFRHPEIEAWLLARMPADSVARIVKRSSILFEGRRIDFPFQKNIHQLPLPDFIECLHDLFFRQGDPDEAETFEQMLESKLGRGIVERFLRPYNEKLYACPLSRLDKDAMGRFFPEADIADIIRNMRHPDPSGYNATFTYPKGGAVQYVEALLRDLPPERIAYGERLLHIDLRRKVARTSRRELAFGHLVSAAPFPQLLQMAAVPHDRSLYTWNKVLVFNLGFDAKGQTLDHWIYIPDPSVRFYRVGFYDNIFGTPRMSLYVEIGMAPGEPVDVGAERSRVLEDLRRCGVIDGQRLVSEHRVLLDPAYVHIHRRGQADYREKSAQLAAAGVHGVGRYGGWTYCSIEDNILQARALAGQIGGDGGG